MQAWLGMYVCPSLSLSLPIILHPVALGGRKHIVTAPMPFWLLGEIVLNQSNPYFPHEI